MLETNTLFVISVFGYECPITEMLIIQWVIMLIGLIISIRLTKNLKRIPDKRQSALEIFVEGVNKIVKDNMGDEYKKFFGPYIGSLILFLASMNLMGLFGFKPPTQNYSVALGMALTTFVMIQATAIKKVGLGHYFAAYGKPIIALTPINIIERVTLPVSLSIRLFGNMFAATITMELAYEALGNIPIFHGITQIAWIGQLLLPIPMHAYFDLFDGTVQMLIFAMLTMVNIKVIADH